MFQTSLFRLSLGAAVAFALLAPTSASAVGCKQDPTQEKCQGGGGGGGSEPQNVRASFRQSVDPSIQGDTTCILADNTEWHYVNPTDTDCDNMVPGIDRSELLRDGTWRLGIQGKEATEGPPAPGPDGPKIVVDRWAAVKFKLIPGTENDGVYDGTLPINEDGTLKNPECLNLDAHIYLDPKYQDDDGDENHNEPEDNDGIANDGGIPVEHPGVVDMGENEGPCPLDTDNLVILIDSNVFDVSDGDTVYFSRFWIASAPSDPNSTLDGGRLWEPRFVLNYYDAWDKETTSDGHIVLRSKPDSTGVHKAELWEGGIKGPVRKGRVADYDMPVEIELKLVSAP